MILSQLIFPSEEAAEKRSLYYRGHADSATNGGLELLPEEPIRFDTYFNAFFYGTYAEHTRIERVSANLVTTGEIDVKVFSVDSQNRERLLAEIEIHGSTARTELPEYSLSDLPVGGALFLEVTAHLSPAYIHSGWYEGAAEGQQVQMAIIICTYRREEYVYSNLQHVREKILENPNCPVSNDIDIFVVDNGKTISLEQAPHILVFPNKNCGGSGGFTRGLLEAHRRGQYTHVLLMDDDISFEPEALFRTIQFLKVAKQTDQPLCIGGQMLLEGRPTVQFEAGSSYIRGRLSPNGQGRDLSSREALLANARGGPAQYNAWWYCCLPLSAIEKNGFPLPLFIKTDDVEYGLRLRPHVVLLNGIGVWHTAFSDKYSPYLEYYIKRNELIVSAIHGSGAGVLPSLRKLLRTFVRALLSGETKVLYFERRACQDFLRGPDFLLRTDGEALHARLLKDRKGNGTSPLIECLRLFRELGRLALRYHGVRLAYQSRWRKLTTEAFWRRYLELN